MPSVKTLAVIPEMILVVWIPDLTDMFPTDWRLLIVNSNADESMLYGIFSVISPLITRLNDPVTDSEPSNGAFMTTVESFLNSKVWLMAGGNTNPLPGGKVNPLLLPEFFKK